MFHTDAIATAFTPGSSLIGGAALFGVGWGIAGVCPGGAIPGLGTGNADLFLFVIAMLAGMVATRTLRKH